MIAKTISKRFCRRMEFILEDKNMTERKGVSVLGLIIGALIAAVFLGAVIGVIADSTIGIAGTGNVTGATGTLLELIPIIIMIGVIVALLTAAGLKVAGKL